MTGESPDTSERTESPGETAQDDAVVPADGAERGAEGGDARLRAAVAAWVAGETPAAGTPAVDEAGPAARGEADADGAEAAERTGRSTAAFFGGTRRGSAAPGDASEAERPAKATATSGAKAGAGSGDTAEPAPRATASDAEAGPGVDETLVVRTGAERPAKAKRTTKPARTAPPRKRASGRPAASDTAPAPEPGSAVESAAEPAAEKPAVEEPAEAEVPGQRPHDASGSEEPAEKAGPDECRNDQPTPEAPARPADEATADGSPEPEPEPAAADTDTEDVKSPEEPAGSPEKTTAPAAGSPDADDDATDVPAEAEAEAEVEAETEAEAAKSPTGKAGSPEKADAAGPADDRPVPSDASDAGDGDTGKSRAGKRVDQPTTAFRTPEDTGRDHATTALRLPEGEPEERPEERTSRFVPLRDPDGRREPALAPQGPDPRLSAPAKPGKDAPERPERPEQPEEEVTETSLSESERTRQMGPPPLDLLAELTNRPPPPETPLRTTVRRVKIWTPLVVLLGIVFVVAQSVRPLPAPTLAMTTPATYAFEGDEPSLPWPSEGQSYLEVSGLGVLGQDGEQKPVPIGSVAKTMTAYVILRDHPLEEGEDGPGIPVDAKAEAEGKLGAGNGDESVLDTIKEGDTISERDALSALMIPSANNVARLLARWHEEKTGEDFVEEMNAAAKQLGMKDTVYTDPSGLEDSTVSTARDQVQLGKKAMEIPALVDITIKPNWTDPSGKEWRNYNDLVPFDGAVGIKTGSTTAAGGNLLFAGRKGEGEDQQLVVGAVLGQHAPPIIDTVNAASRTLLDEAGELLRTETVVKKGDVVGHVDDGLGGRTPLVATEDVKAVGWTGLTVELGMDDGDEAVPHAAKVGEKVGFLTAGDGPGQVRVPVALGEDLAEPGFAARLTRIL